MKTSPTDISLWLAKSVVYYTCFCDCQFTDRGFWKEEQKSFLLSSSFLLEPNHILHLSDSCRAAALFLPHLGRTAASDLLLKFRASDSILLKAMDVGESIKMYYALVSSVAV